MWWLIFAGALGDQRLGRWILTRLVAFLYSASILLRARSKIKGELVVDDDVCILEDLLLAGLQFPISAWFGRLIPFFIWLLGGLQGSSLIKEPLEYTCDQGCHDISLVGVIV
ncbi:hypothetical protein FH972_013335 [Carpinus fangiana]|uniref:Uncharacterized protein n=1 Tax=Carpinus fangiana TaxID=176857 RepID=A0A5N6R6E5_9ROSI|nr:hypothetical protein FH972_013335 [Carpinus fangiana]